MFTHFAVANKGKLCNPPSNFKIPWDGGVFIRESDEDVVEFFVVDTEKSVNILGCEFAYE